MLAVVLLRRRARGLWPWSQDDLYEFTGEEFGGGGDGYAEVVASWRRFPNEDGTPGPLVQVPPQEFDDGLSDEEVERGRAEWLAYCRRNKIRF